MLKWLSFFNKWSCNPWRIQMNSINLILYPMWVVVKWGKIVALIHGGALLYGHPRTYLPILNQETLVHLWHILHPLLLPNPFRWLAHYNALWNLRVQIRLFNMARFICKKWRLVIRVFCRIRRIQYLIAFFSIDLWSLITVMTILLLCLFMG